MDLLDLKSTVKEIETGALPEAGNLVNGALANAAALLNGVVNNAAILSANLLQGVEGERLEAMTGIETALAPIVEQWKRTNDVLERMAAILERVNLKP